MSAKFTHSPALQEFAYSPATAWLKSLHNKLTTEPMSEFKFSPSTAWLKDIPCVKKSFQKYGNASPSKDERSDSVEIEADHKPASLTFLGSDLKPPVTYSAADDSIRQLSAADDNICRLSAADRHVTQPLSDQTSVSGLKNGLSSFHLPTIMSVSLIRVKILSLSTLIRRLARKILSVGMRDMILSLTYIRANTPVFHFHPVVMVPFSR